MFTQKNFILTGEEYDAIKTWADEHECSCRCNDGRVSRSCCGGEISVTFTPTTVGMAKSARCICGKELDLNTL